MRGKQELDGVEPILWSIPSSQALVEVHQLNGVSVLGPDGVSQLGLQLGHSYGAVKERTVVRIRRLMKPAKAASFVSADEETLLIIRREFIPSTPGTPQGSPGGGDLGDNSRFQ